MWSSVWPGVATTLSVTPSVLITIPPPKDRPWYHVLVDGQPAQTYVAERNLEHCESRPIRHPLVDQYFAEYKGGRYVPRHLKT